jgi:hypothetical protein
VGGVDPKPAERPRPLAIQIVQSAGDLIDCRPQSFEEATPRIGRGDAPRRSVQQADAHPFFQLPDPMTEGRRGDAEARRSRSEAEIVGDRDEGGQVRQLASTHCLAPRSFPTAEKMEFIVE